MSKISLVIIILILGFIIVTNISNNNYQEQPNFARLLLSKLRNGDYTHAGHVEAIDLILKKVITYDNNIYERKTLDIGCGFGGTLHYFKQNGFKDCVGIDFDETAIAYARKKYSDIQFHHLDALKIGSVFKENFFINKS